MSQADADVVVAMNQSVVDVTSPMDTDSFAELYHLSSMRFVIETDNEVAAFVFAMSDGCEYDNDNYRWFSERLSSFLYIDRIVVSDVCRGRGIGRTLYSRIYSAALQLGALSICAEMNLDPPNRSSLRFHERAGFIQVGTRLLSNGKRLSMQTCSTESAVREA